MLIVKIPNACVNEQEYIISIMMDEFLGLEYRIEHHKNEYIEISNEHLETQIKTITFDASFFLHASKEWLKEKTLPKQPIKAWDIVKDGINLVPRINNIPVLFGNHGFRKNSSSIHVNFDIFGSCFFMISRYEEAVIMERDIHNRFPASLSIAYKENFLDRPVVNECVELLFWFLKLIAPNLKRMDKHFTKFISCDVDHPYDLVGNSFMKTFLRVGARVVRDKNIGLAGNDFLNYIFKKFNSDYFDFNANRIKWIINLNNKVGNKVAFNFIPIQTNDLKDDPNNISDKKIIKLLKLINDSGHEIGIHPGYDSYNDRKIFENSLYSLKEITRQNSINDVSGGRQHFLRYDISTTPKLWDDYGLQYDSTLGFAEVPGFRCGVCYEFSMYDLLNRCKLKIKQRPLICMDVSMLVHEKIKTNSKQLLRRVDTFKNKVKEYNGDFTLLWHNNNLVNAETYINLIS